jgi:hypothetical protein
MATEFAGKYSNFLDPDLIKFGQKGSSAFSENSNQTGDDKLINLFRELRSPEAMRGVLQAKLDFDKEQMARAFNPLADPTTAAIVLNSYQGGLAGQRDIIRNIPQLQTAQFGMPSKNYFSSLG